MRAEPFPLEPSPPASDAGAVPFASEFVRLTKQEHIHLLMQANYFKSLHERAVARAAWREDRYQRVLRQMKAQGAQREAALQAELEAAQAHIQGSAAAPVWPQKRTPQGRKTAGPRLRFPCTPRASAWHAGPWPLHAVKPASAP